MTHSPLKVAVWFLIRLFALASLAAAAAAVSGCGELRVRADNGSLSIDLKLPPRAAEEIDVLAHVAPAGSSNEVNSGHE